MNSPVNYLFESGISLTFLVLVYVFFLRHETFFRMNRFFLLGSILFSVLLPFLKFRIYEPGPVMLAEVTVTPYRNLVEAVTIYGRSFSDGVEKAVLSTDMIVIIYFAGLTFFLFRFIFRLIHLSLLIRESQVKVFNGVKYVIQDSEFSPFSFLGYVFIGSSSGETEHFDKILAHESEHVRQGHSIDVILLEVLTIFQWFNPAVWILRRAIRENHEFLADEAVLSTGISRGNYKKLLIGQFTGDKYKLASNFNYSLIKNRLKMISKIRSSRISVFKVLFGIFIASGLVIAFACEQKKLSEGAQGPISGEMSIVIKGDSLRIEGSSEDLKKVNALLNSGRFKVTSDSLASGFLVLSERSISSSSLHEGEEVFFIVEQMPEFPGGEKELRKFIASKVHYPPDAQSKGIQGKVYVTFIVSKDGSVKNAKIVRGVSPELDEEALRVVNQLPAWKPGRQKGVPVNVSYTVPISFVLQ